MLSMMQSSCSAVKDFISRIVFELIAPPRRFSFSFSSMKRRPWTPSFRGLEVSKEKTTSGNCSEILTHWWSSEIEIIPRRCIPENDLRCPESTKSFHHSYLCGMWKEKQTTSISFDAWSNQRCLCFTSRPQITPPRSNPLR